MTAWRASALIALVAAAAPVGAVTRIQAADLAADAAIVERSAYFDAVGKSPFLSPPLLANPITEVPPEASATPEPASWALMIAGFGLIGAAMRRRARAVAA